MNAIINSIAINSIASVQFGNSFDTNGFEVKDAKILATQKRLAGTVYLIQAGNTVGIALLSNGTVKADLHCTSALIVPTHAKTIEAAAEMHGFSDYKAA